MKMKNDKSNTKLSWPTNPISSFEDPFILLLTTKIPKSRTKKKKRAGDFSKVYETLCRTKILCPFSPEGFSRHLCGLEHTTELAFFLLVWGISHSGVLFNDWSEVKIRETVDPQVETSMVLLQQMIRKLSSPRFVLWHSDK